MQSYLSHLISVLLMSHLNDNSTTKAKNEFGYDPHKRGKLSHGYVLRPGKYRSHMHTTHLVLKSVSQIYIVKVYLTIRVIIICIILLIVKIQ